MDIVRHLMAVSAVLILAASVGRAEAAPAPVTFFDGDFETGWRDIVSIHPPFYLSSASVVRLESGGNPDAFRFSSLHLSNAQGLTGGVYEMAGYDPGSEGAIASIDFSIDINHFRWFRSTDLKLILEQDDTIYYSIPFVRYSSAYGGLWEKQEINRLKASDFDTNPFAGLPAIVPDGVMPDFSSTGSAILLGYILRNDSSSYHGHAVGIDNWSVTVNPVPLPAAFVFLASAVAALLGAAAAARRHSIAAA